MRYGIPVLTCLCLLVAPLAHAQITTFSDRPTFDAAVGPTTLETFTNTFHFPISSGVLNSLTNDATASGPPILPGDIQPGVTYSTPVGSGNFFNIDAGANFTGGFLDTVTGNGPLTITFDSPVRAFGFDTNALVGSSMTVTINGGTPFANTLPVAPTFNMQFFGFESGAQDITSVTLFSPGSVSFAIDNFVFPAGGTPPPPVPEPGSVALLIGMGLSGAGFLARRRRNARQAV
jgi:hypothetical protein